MEKAAIKGIPYGVASFEEGKSVFVSMMQAYYDIAKADRFDTLFDGLWIKEHPTPLKNAFQVIYFDFSIIGTGFDEQSLEQNFNKYCCQVLGSKRKGKIELYQSACAQKRLSVVFDYRRIR